MFGSVLVPLKALVLNLLSLTATFGAMVWVFQDGHLSGVLDFTATGTIDATTPILMFCIAFGLSMDYEVFLLSRIKEEHDRGATTGTSVALGLERTGRIVTAAALLISVVFLAFATVAGQLHQAVRHRPHAGRADGRLRHPRHARPGVHAPGRRRELVGAPLDAPDPRPDRHQRARRPRRPEEPVGRGRRDRSAAPGNRSGSR